MQNYNFIQKIFHDLVLSNKVINSSLFEIDKMLYLKNEDIQKNLHIFITGLPRSGSTSILNFIYSTNEFGSLKYLNMPFVLAPNISKKIIKKNIPKKQRLHNDGITYDLDTPEAFDEIFFRNSEEFVEKELLNYLTLILISENCKRYLSKNNLNYKRIDLINSILKNCIFLIPIRNPIQQSYSLLNQQQNFTFLQKKDSFIKRYMNYLGHNEFGIIHKPWHKPNNFNNLDDINYWLEQWCFFYKNIFKKYQNKNNCYFITYENLQNQSYLNNFLNILQIKNRNCVDLNYFKDKNKKLDLKLDKHINKESIEVYENIKSKSYLLSK